MLILFSVDLLPEHSRHVLGPTYCVVLAQVNIHVNHLLELSRTGTFKLGM